MSRKRRPRQGIVRLLKQRGPMTVAEIAALTGRKYSAIYWRLHNAIKRGQIAQNVNGVFAVQDEEDAERALRLAKIHSRLQWAKHKPKQRGGVPGPRKLVLTPGKKRARRARIPKWAKELRDMKADAAAANRSAQKDRNETSEELSD